MVAATGTSVRGIQTLINATSAVKYEFSLSIDVFPLPPAINIGYFYLFQYKNSGNFPSYVVSRGRVYRPGIWEVIPVKLFDNTYAYRLDVDWNIAGLKWTVNLI